MQAAERATINVKSHLITVYAIAGALSGLAGYLALARFGTTTIAGHATDNLQAITAVVIGGTSLFGGIGTMLGTCIGMFIPAVLQNGFVITLNGGDAQGVVTALREAGKQNQVKFISGDAQPFQVAELKKGEVAELLLHKPFEIGEKGVEQALAAVNGQPVQPESTTSIVVATAANVDDPEVAKYLYRPC